MKTPECLGRKGRTTWAEQQPACWVSAPSLTWC